MSINDGCNPYTLLSSPLPINQDFDTLWDAFRRKKGLSFVPREWAFTPEVHEDFPQHTEWKKLINYLGYVAGLDANDSQIFVSECEDLSINVPDHTAFQIHNPILKRLYKLQRELIQKQNLSSEFPCETHTDIECVSVEKQEKLLWYKTDFQIAKTIAEEGFQKFARKGFAGLGFYFSSNQPKVNLGETLILCRVLFGTVLTSMSNYDPSKLSSVFRLTNGTDFELAVFDSDLILPEILFVQH